MTELKEFARSNAAARIRAAARGGALNHALILSGAGDRLACAYYAAAALECTASEKPCLACAHCRKVMEGIHPDVTLVRDEEHVELSAEVVRGVRTDAFIRPNEGACRVYIFPDCAVLNEKDQNILLKTVEEGPEYAAFLFCAENVQQLLPTVRSRCVELKLPPDGAAERSDPRAEELCRVLSEGERSARAALFVHWENARVGREELRAVFDQARTLLVAALAARCGAVSGAANGETLQKLVTSRLTKAQIIGTIEILGIYRDHCNYNVGVGPLLGGLAVELEEIL